MPSPIVGRRLPDLWPMATLRPSRYQVTLWGKCAGIVSEEGHRRRLAVGGRAGFRFEQPGPAQGYGHGLGQGAGGYAILRATVGVHGADARLGAGRGAAKNSLMLGRGVVVS